MLWHYPAPVLGFAEGEGGGGARYCPRAGAGRDIAEGGGGSWTIRPPQA